jgi:hypothetical protein
MAADDDIPLSALKPKKSSFGDEMPLASLSKPKKSSVGDDVPLSTLAAPAGAKKTGGRPSLGGPPAKKFPRATNSLGQIPGLSKKRTVQRRTESSSSSDSSSSSTDSTSDSDAAVKKKNKKRLKLIRPKAEGDEEENKIKKKDRGTKEQVAVELLCRWWYVLPDWPPNDKAGKEEVARKLEKNNLRQVSIQEWEWVPELDDRGRRKVYELTQFRGIFRASDGTKYDLRPMDTCPSFNNMMRKELSELYGLLVKAYEGQLEELKQSKYDESELRNKLNLALTRAREKAHHAEQLTFNAGLRKKA